MAIDFEQIVLGVGLLTPIYAFLHKLTLQQEKHSESIDHILNVINSCRSCKTSIAERLADEAMSD